MGLKHGMLKNLGSHARIFLKYSWSMHENSRNHTGLAKGIFDVQVGYGGHFLVLEHYGYKIIYPFLCGPLLLEPL